MSYRLKARAKRRRVRAFWASYNAKLWRAYERFRGALRRRDCGNILTFGLVLAILAGCTSAQLVGVDVQIPDGREAADAIGYHLVEASREGVRAVEAARGTGPLVTTDLREALHIEPGAFVLTVPPEAILVREGAVQVTVVIPVDKATEIILPWASDVLLPLLDQRLQMIQDDVRTSVGRDSRELTATAQEWLPRFFWLAAGVALAALVLGAVWVRRNTVDDVARGAQ